MLTCSWLGPDPLVYAWVLSVIGAERKSSSHSRRGPLIELPSKGSGVGHLLQLDKQLHQCFFSICAKKRAKAQSDSSRLRWCRIQVTAPSSSLGPSQCSPACGCGSSRPRPSECHSCRKQRRSPLITGAKLWNRWTGRFTLIRPPRTWRPSRRSSTLCFPPRPSLRDPRPFKRMIPRECKLSEPRRLWDTARASQRFTWWRMWMPDGAEGTRLCRRRGIWEQAREVKMPHREGTDHHQQLGSSRRGE